MSSDPDMDWCKQCGQPLYKGNHPSGSRCSQARANGTRAVRAGLSRAGDRLLRRWVHRVVSRPVPHPGPSQAFLDRFPMEA